MSIKDASSPPFRWQCRRALFHVLVSSQYLYSEPCKLVQGVQRRPRVAPPLVLETVTVVWTLVEPRNVVDGTGLCVVNGRVALSVVRLLVLSSTVTVVVSIVVSSVINAVATPSAAVW